MDYGHYNCRDYHVSPHFAPTTISKIIHRDRAPLFRHESFDELEQRSRSPKPKTFPLLQLPLELRQLIFSYLLPRTLAGSNPNPLASHARNFSAVKKRGAKGMIIPQINGAQKASANIVWQRGNIHLLPVCRQLHDECAELLYGHNTFLLFVTYTGITFRFCWQLPSGLAPTQRYNFLELVPSKYMAFIKRIIVNVDHVDSYTGMIKFNVSGKGLTYGLRKQVQRLVNALLPSEAQSGEGKDGSLTDERRRLVKVSIRVSNGNAVLDQIKSDIVRRREGGVKVAEDVQEMLDPFSDLRGVREVSVTGAVTETFARSLIEKMTSMEKLDPTALAAHAV